MKKNFLLILLISAFGASVIFSMDEKGMVMIKSPKEMSEVDSGKKISIEYEAEAGKNGDHLHLNVDGNREAVIRELKGSTEVGPLKTGKHKICLAINTKMHMPTGAEGCVNVTAK